MNKAFLDQKDFKDKQDKNEYYNGKAGTKYGIYNTYKNCFQFRICEDSPHLALARLYYMIGKGAGHPKFDPRAISNAKRSVEEILASKLINLCSTPSELTENYHFADFHFSKQDCIKFFNMTLHTYRKEDQTYSASDADTIAARLYEDFTIAHDTNPSDTLPAKLHKEIIKTIEETVQKLTNTASKSESEV